MNERKLTKIFFFISLGTIFIFLNVLYYFDPLKLFHAPWSYENLFQSNMRQQAKGILNTQPHDSIILGSSMLECSSAKEASLALKSHFINISLSGSSFFERAFILQYALKKHPLKYVVYSLDERGLIRQETGRGLRTNYSLDKWSYLYDTNPFNDIKAYMNKKYLKCIFLTADKQNCIGHKINLDAPNAWSTNPDEMRRFGGIDNLFKIKDNNKIKNYYKEIYFTIKKIKNNQKNIDPRIELKIKNGYKYLNETLITYVKKYPQTSFIFLLPPYSRAKYAIEAQYNKSYFEIRKKMIKYLVKCSQQYSNMEIYGWGNYNFLDDIANYKDLGHYHPKINSFMISEIKNKSGLLTNNNIHEYLKQFTQKALNYDLSILYKHLKAYLYPERHN